MVNFPFQKDNLLVPHFRQTLAQPTQLNLARIQFAL